MKMDGYYVVGREINGGSIVFLHTIVVGGVLSQHWGTLKFADRYLMFGDAKEAAENAPSQHENDGPAAVWRVEVTAEKETI